MVLGLCSCINPTFTSPSPIHVPSLDFNLKSEEYEAKVAKAKLGDVESAYDLALFYGFVMNDDQNEIFWLRRAAELGSKSAFRDLNEYKNNTK